jgi:hypothetical protein
VIAPAEEEAHRQEQVMEPKYPPETIRRYREMRDKKAFERTVRERTPVDLEYDEFTLDRGHKQVTLANLLEANMSNTWHCSDCAREWLEKAQEE